MTREERDQELVDAIHDAAAEVQEPPAPFGRCDVCGDALDRQAGHLCLACELEGDA